jgi:uncharacterized membrane protein YgcG
MKIRGKNACPLALIVGLMLLCIAPGAQAADRELHWDALDVDAHLDADGVLDVTERHTMVFTGDWNGGERVFNVRPRQKLELLGLQRIDLQSGSLHALQETSVPNNVDEFAWTDRRTLRWRSRLPSDAPFANTQLIYVLHYKLSGILLKEDEQFRIDHDFAFPDRSGAIEHFTLNLELDPVWQPLGKYQNRYMAGPLEPGERFVVNIPLRYSGSGEPTALDTRRPRETVVAVMALLGIFALLVLAFMMRERSLGRFTSVDPTGIDSAWIENNILKYPAEVVGAAWDGRIAASEVVALIARMTAEGKLESTVDGPNSMRLRLKADRGTLNGHERELVNGLFFGNRTETSTKEVRQHYKSSGFNPASIIKPLLDREVKAVLPEGDKRVGHLLTVLLYVAALVLLALSSYSEPVLVGGAVFFAFISLFVVALLQIPGWLFRSRIDWGLKAAAVLLIPASVVSLGMAVFLWWSRGLSPVDLPWTMPAGLAVLALAISNASINGMKSRQSSAVIAFRKRLARGRNFFLKELERPQPDLRDGWYPWMLAFGLGKQVDLWSTRHPSTTTDTSTSGYSTTQSSSSSPSTNTGMGTGWSGGGGLSGGAGASGAWAVAAAGMAAGVAAPSSSSSSGSSSSSSGGSSGGGGGGGW